MNLKIYLLTWLTALLFFAKSEAQTPIPYPVWFDLGEQPELKVNAVFRSGTGTTFTNGSFANLQWEGTQPTVAYGSMKKDPGGNSRNFGFGDYFTFNFWNTKVLKVKIPYLLAGKYQFHIGYRAGGDATMWTDIDSLKVVDPGVDTTKQYMNDAGYVRLNAGTRAYINPTAKVMAQQICNITIPRDGSFWLYFYLRSNSSSKYLNQGIDQFHFFPTKLLKDINGNDSIAIKYPEDLTTKFDIAGYFNPITPITDFSVVGYNPLSYQAKDSSIYTKYNVNIEFGSFFKSAPVQILRDEDKWTRMVVDTLTVGGTLTCQLPAGKYYYWVKNGVYKGSFTVTGDGSFDFKVNSYDVTVQAGAESWIIGKTLKVFDFATKTVLNAQATFAVDGSAIVNMLPGQYYYEINGKFANGDFTVTNGNISVNAVKTKYNVTFKFGGEAWFANKGLQVWLNSDKSIEMYNVAANASGDVTIGLPNQTYYFNMSNGFTVDTFSVFSKDTVLNRTARYNANINLGNNGDAYTWDIFRNDTIKISLGTVSSGAFNMNSIPNGKYSFRVFKPNGADSLWITKKYTFYIKGANYVYGEPGNAGQAIILPYPVYFDVANQPEIKWGKTGQSFASNAIAGIQISSANAINYVYATSVASNDLKNAFINGDYVSINLGNTTIPTFVKIRTPWVNKGRYNVYVNHRFNGSANKPKVDSTFIDGILLDVSDGLTRTFAGSADGKVTRIVSAHGAGEVAAIHLGSVDIPVSGMHDLKIVSNAGGTEAFWLDMLFFIPVDQDVAINGTYYPRFDFCGNAVFAGGTPVLNNGSKGEYHAETYQVSDPSVYTGLTKQLLFDAGAMSNGDRLLVTNTIDNWTRAWTRTLNTDADTTQILPGTYNFVVKHEGLSGTFTMNDNYTVTIPTSIPTIVSGWAKLYKDESLDTAQRNIDLMVNVAMDFSNYSLKIDTMKGTSDVLVSAIAVDPYLHGITDTLKLQAVDIAVDANYDATPAFLATGIQAKYQGWGRFTASNGYLTATDVVTGNQFAKDATLRTFPNPAKETLFIQTSKVGTKDSYIIYNALGNVVGSGKIKASTTSVNLKGLPSGVYYVKIKAGTSATTSKLMKE